MSQEETYSGKFIYDLQDKVLAAEQHAADRGSQAISDDEFIANLENRHMSSWTNEETRRYNDLTGQAECRNCGEIEVLHQLGIYCTTMPLDLAGRTAVLSPRFEPK